MLVLSDIGKSFGATRAVGGVSLEVGWGTVIGLVGENGAGKSTLIKMVSGAILPDEGTISVDGVTIAPHGTHEALALGIASVFQELTVVRDLTVEQNLLLSAPPVTPWRTVDKRAMRRMARAILERYQIDLDPGCPVRDLSLGQQQMLEIVRAIERRPRILVLDEATSALGAVEVDWLMGHVQGLRQKGCIVLFISHRWDEITSFCNRVAVLRNGTLVAVKDTGALSESEAVQLMTGRDQVQGYYPPKPPVPGPVALSAQGLHSDDLRGIDLAVRYGEVLGLGGLVGQGQGPLLEAAFGIHPLKSGTLALDGQPHRATDPKGAMRSGISYVPQERKSEGLLLHKSVGTNLTLAILDRLKAAFGFLHPGAEADCTGQAISRARIKTQGAAEPIANLSGGNQQKVLLEKWLLTKPRVLLLNDVTRGVDVGTRHQIYEVIAEVARSGVAVIWYSTDARELVGVAHRVLVLLGGRISAELSGADLRVDSIIHASVVGTASRQGAQ